MKGAVFDENTSSKIKIFGAEGVVEQIKNKLQGIYVDKNGFKSFKNMETVNLWAEDAYKEWFDSISEKEEQAIIDYTGEDYYRNINRVLRGLDNKYEDNNAEIVDNLTMALDKAKVPENITLYRGTSLNSLGELANLEPEDLIGQQFEDKGFFSASFDKNVAVKFKDNLILEINVPKGTSGAYVAKYSQFGSESELLLNRGQRMLIKGYDDTNPEFLILKVEITNM